MTVDSEKTLTTQCLRNVLIVSVRVGTCVSLMQPALICSKITSANEFILSCFTIDHFMFSICGTKQLTTEENMQVSPITEFKLLYVTYM